MAVPNGIVEQQKDDSVFLSALIEDRSGLLWFEIPDRIFEHYQFRNPSVPEVRILTKNPNTDEWETSWIPLNTFPSSRRYQNAFLSQSDPTTVPPPPANARNGGGGGNGQNGSTGGGDDSGVLGFLTSFFQGFSEAQRPRTPTGPVDGTSPPSGTLPRNQAGGRGSGMLPIILFGAAGLGVVYIASQSGGSRAILPPRQESPSGSGGKSSG